MNLDTYTYIIVRKDLSPEQICVQSSHAAIEMAKSYMKPDTYHPNLVICMVRNSRKLEEVAERLEEANITYKPFYDSDDGNGMTALATAPLVGEQRMFFNKFMLLKIRTSNVM